MPGYVYRGNDRDVVKRRENSDGYLSTRINDIVGQRALNALKDNHAKEFRKIVLWLENPEILGPMENSHLELRQRNNIARTVLRRKYPEELAALKDKIRPQVYAEFNYKPRPVGKSTKQSKYEDIIEALLRIDFT